MPRLHSSQIWIFIPLAYGSVGFEFTSLRTALFLFFLTFCFGLFTRSLVRRRFCHLKGAFPVVLSYRTETHNVVPIRDALITNTEDHRQQKRGRKFSSGKNSGSGFRRF